MNQASIDLLKELEGLKDKPAATWDSYYNYEAEIKEYFTTIIIYSKENT